VLAPLSKDHLAIRSGDWMYIPGQGGGGFTGTEIGAHLLGGPAATRLTGRPNSDIEVGRLKADAPRAQLYNLAKDPYQTTNVYRQYPALAAELQELLERETR
jgi:hypothetical protein